MKILFICSGGIQRSPTFAKWVNNNSKHDAKSMGLWNNPNYELLNWADKIYVMDLSHEIWFHKFRPKYLPKIKTIGISDQYQPDEEDLKELIEYWFQTKTRLK